LIKTTLFLIQIDTFIYNGQVLGKKNNFWYFRGYAESSGNLLDGIVKMFIKEPSEDGYYKLINIRYAQYVKAEVGFPDITML